MIVVWARYHGGMVKYNGFRFSHDHGDLDTLVFFDMETARVAFALAGNGTCCEVEDDEGFVHFPIDTTCGFSACRREMEMRGNTFREGEKS
jgi:hypothetical protein